MPVYFAANPGFEILFIKIHQKIDPCIRIKLSINKEKEIEIRDFVVIINFLNRKKFIQNTTTATNSPTAKLVNFCFIVFFKLTIHLQLYCRYFLRNLFFLFFVNWELLNSLIGYNMFNSILSKYIGELFSYTPCRYSQIFLYTIFLPKG